MQRSRLHWLPNFFTTLTLFSGVYTITFALNGQLHAAVHAVMFAMIFDFLDGYIARKTNTMSLFGKEYDSLCDMVAFGLAPALVLHQVLNWDSLLSAVIPGVFCCSVAIRLAYFNTLESSTGSFEGLPCTAAGPSVVLMSYCLGQYAGKWFGGLLLTIVVLFLAYLMNSKYTYRSLKQNKHYLRKLSWALVIVLCIAVNISPLVILSVVLFFYVLSPFMRRLDMSHWRGKVAQYNG